MDVNGIYNLSMDPTARVHLKIGDELSYNGAVFDSARRVISMLARNYVRRIWEPIRN
jgi:flagellar biosynthesis regulator FlbT